MNLKTEAQRNVIPELMEKVYNVIFEYGGSMTAEHNDGIIRTPYLEKMYGKEIVSLFAKVKEIFDPKHILNPGKKVGGTAQYAFSHIDQKF